MLAKYNNFAGWTAAVLLALNLVLSIAYLIQKDYRRAAYFFFSFCIMLTVAV